MPPLTRAETYGPLKDLEALLDEYYAASGMDRRRLADLKRRILDFVSDSRLDRDIGLPEDETQALIKMTTSSVTSRKPRSAMGCTSSGSRRKASCNATSS